MKSLNNQWGISLVEVMVALMLSLFLLAGIVQVYVGNKATFSFTNALAEIQENGRYALDLMSQDLRLAGVWGCIPYDPSDTDNINDTLATEFKNQDGIMGTEGGNAGGVMSPDTLTIRGGKPGQANVRAPFTAAASNTINTNSFNSIAAGDVILVARCGKNDLGAATPEADILSVTGVAHGANTVITHNGAKSQQFGNDAIVLELQDVTYSIAPSVSGEAGATSLFRQEFAAAPEELVEGVENMQVLYGIDTSGNQYANQYVTAAQPGIDFDNVVSIRLQLLLRSLDDFVADAPQVYTFAGSNPITADDRRIRQVFTATVALRNRIGSER